MLPSCPGQDKETSTPGTSQLWGSAHGWCFCLLTSVGESISAANSQVVELVCIWLLGQPIDFPFQGRVRGFGNSIPGIQGRAIIIITITVLWTDRTSGIQLAFSLILCPSSLKAGRRTHIMLPMSLGEKDATPRAEQCSGWRTEPRAWGLSHHSFLLEGQKQS